MVYTTLDLTERKRFSSLPVSPQSPRLAYGPISVCLFVQEGGSVQPESCPPLRQGQWEGDLRVDRDLGRGTPEGWEQGRGSTQEVETLQTEKEGTGTVKSGLWEPQVSGDPLILPVRWALLFSES